MQPIGRRLRLRPQTDLLHGLLLIYRPLRDGRLSWSGWLTHSGHLTRKVVTCQSQITRTSGKVSQPKTDILTTEPQCPPSLCCMPALCSRAPLQLEYAAWFVALCKCYASSFVIDADSKYIQKEAAYLATFNTEHHSPVTAVATCRQCGEQQPRTNLINGQMWCDFIHSTVTRTRTRSTSTAR